MCSRQSFLDELPKRHPRYCQVVGNEQCQNSFDIPCNTSQILIPRGNRRNRIVVVKVNCEGGASSGPIGPTGPTGPASTSFETQAVQNYGLPLEISFKSSGSGFQSIHGLEETSDEVPYHVIHPHNISGLSFSKPSGREIPNGSSIFIVKNAVPGDDPSTGYYSTEGQLIGRITIDKVIGLTEGAWSFSILPGEVGYPTPTKFSADKDDESIVFTSWEVFDNLVHRNDRISLFVDNENFAGGFFTLSLH